MESDCDVKSSQLLERTSWTLFWNVSGQLKLSFDSFFHKLQEPGEFLRCLPVDSEKKNYSCNSFRKMYIRIISLAVSFVVANKLAQCIFLQVCGINCQQKTPVSLFFSRFLFSFVRAGGTDCFHSSFLGVEFQSSRKHYKLREDHDTEEETVEVELQLWPELPLLGGLFTSY